MDIAVEKPHPPRAFSRPPFRSQRPRGLHGCLAERIAWETIPIAAPIIELAPRTEALSLALIGRGVREENLVLVERNEARASYLRARYPTARILCSESMDIATQRNLFFGRRAGAVESATPLREFTSRQHEVMASRHIRLTPT